MATEEWPGTHVHTQVWRRQMMTRECLETQVCTESINFLHSVLLAYQLKLNLVERCERR